jgi:hypothetical protein
MLSVLRVKFFIERDGAFAEYGSEARKSCWQESRLNCDQSIKMSARGQPLSEAPLPPWLDRDWLLGQFGGRRRTAIGRYIDFIRSGCRQESIWADLGGQLFLGSEAFVETMKRQLPKDRDLREVPRVQRRPLAKPLSDYTRFSHRHEGMAQAYFSGDYTMRQIADAFGVHYATVSRAVRARENRGKPL